jgi:SAM-dependent methyltransferase
MNKISLNPHKICALCEGEAICVYEGIVGYVEGTTYNVYECSVCNSSFVDPMSNLKEEYDIIYGGDETKDGSYDYYYYLAEGVKKLKNPLKDLANFTAVYWGVVKALRDNHIVKGAKVLEVGPGLGYFTYALRKSGYDCEGLEYSKTAVDFANNFFGKHYTEGTIEEYSKVDIHKGKYDLVVATEVIEHVVDPKVFIENILEVLKPGGTIILTTPIKDIHPKGTIWETNPAPEHLWWFTEKGIESAAEAYHAKTSFVDFTEYTTHKIWSVHTGTAHSTPHTGPVVNKDGISLRAYKKGYKEKVMGILPAWFYMKLVCLYHDLKFLQRNKAPSKYMYGMCAVITKAL